MARPRAGARPRPDPARRRGLRFWSLGHGLPYAYNLDERAHFVPHAVAMTSGDLNPGYFINPPALTYLLAAWLSRRSTSAASSSGSPTTRAPCSWRRA